MCKTILIHHWQHVFYALNQCTRLSLQYQHAGVPRATAQIDVNIPQAELLFGNVPYPIWPEEILRDIPATEANAFLHRRTRPTDFNQDVARMEMELQPQFPALQFEVDSPDPCARIREYTLARMRRHVAEFCAFDDKWKQEFKLMMTPAIKVAIRLEQLQRVAERCFSALTERQLDCAISDPTTSLLEFQVKRNLEYCASAISEIYRNLLLSISDDDVPGDILKAARAAVSALIYMIEGVLKRNRPIADRGGASLWEEMIWVDVDLHNKEDFWTCVYDTFSVIHPEDLTNAQRKSLRDVYRFARNDRLQGIQRPQILEVLSYISTR
jgi:hypothetical protein